MDASLYRTVNRFAERTPWLHGLAVAYAKCGVVIFAVLLLLAWWRARRTGDLEAEARIGWAGAATLIALGLGQIIGHLVDRARPYAVLPHVHVLVAKSTDVVAGLLIAALVAAAGARPGSRLLREMLIHLERIPGVRWITGRDAEGSPAT